MSKSEETEEEYVYSEDEDEIEYEEHSESEAGTTGTSLTSGKTIPSMVIASETTTEGNKDTVEEIIHVDQLRSIMTTMVEEVASILNFTIAQATALLRSFAWNKERLYEAIMDDRARVLKEVGLVDGGQAAEPMPSNKKLLCYICNEEYDGQCLFALACKHYFCKLCWAGYVHYKLLEGPGCVFATCPWHQCQILVTDDIFKKFLNQSEAARYEKFVINKFVDINKYLRWCPGKNCSFLIKAPLSCKRVKCKCGMTFCFRCGEEAHEPSSCEALAKWKEKCQNESETANWILAHTKKCTKCQTRIEKNQGCNHMTCRQCLYEFCWVCEGPWSDHGAGTGGYYKCNRYDSAKHSDTESVATRARAELDRYLHYYRRYHSHSQAQQYAERQHSVTERRMVELQESEGGSTWIDVQFLKSATDQVIECRRVLKYTYVFGYYMTDEDPFKLLFEHNQENLEKFTEHLHGLAEKPLKDLMSKEKRAEVINYTRVTGRYCTSLLEGMTQANA